jgi:hypothetical protein
MPVLREMFPGRHISLFQKQLACPHTDLLAPDSFHWGIKSKAYEACAANTDDLKQQIQEYIQRIPNEILHVMVL